MHKPNSESIYQIKIKLLSIQPWIWRRVFVSEAASLQDLHRIIQTIMPWDGSHPHRFFIKNKYYGPYIAKSGGNLDEETLDEKKITLGNLELSQKQRFRYIYDFGDKWIHEITIEKIIFPDSSQFYPFCVAGKNKAPPDDCGGAWGYSNLLDILADPKNPDYKDRAQCLGESFDPTKYNINEANQRLKSLFSAS
jgi:AAA+ ATPase superfamily predicted ATPase